MPRQGFAEERFPAVLAEAEANGADLYNPAAFSMIGAVGAIVADLRPDLGSTGEPLTADLSHRGSLLFHAYHFWAQDQQLTLAKVSGLREILEVAPPTIPAGAEPGSGYVQFPRHLVWLESDPEAPESLDGFFWVLSPAAEVHLLLVGGIRPGAEGFTVVPVPSLPLSEFNDWSGEEAREGGMEFASSLPGADLEGLLGMVTGAEAVKLASRVLGAHFAFGVQADAGASVSTEGQDPDPSALPFGFLVTSENDNAS